MTTHIPLSLRRKIVIALDADRLLPAALSNPNVASEGSEDVSEATAARFSTFKTVAWAKANLIRSEEDHVFLVTCINPDAQGPLDTTTIANMWSSMFAGQENHSNRVKEAEAALRRLSDALSHVGVSASIEVVLGNAAEKVPEFVHVHRGELLVVQAPVRSVLAATLAYSWADICAQQAECPTVVVKQTDLRDNVAVALDPPLPTPTQAE